MGDAHPLKWNSSDGIAILRLENVDLQIDVDKLSQYIPLLSFYFSAFKGNRLVESRMNPICDNIIYKKIVMHRFVKLSFFRIHVTLKPVSRQMR